MCRLLQCDDTEDANRSTFAGKIRAENKGLLPAPTDTCTHTHTLPGCDVSTQTLNK